MGKMETLTPCKIETRVNRLTHIKNQSIGKSSGILATWWDHVNDDMIGLGLFQRTNSLGIHGDKKKSRETG